MLLDTMIILDLKSKDYKVYKEFNKNLPISAISKQIMFQCDRFLGKVEEYENKNLNGMIIYFLINKGICVAIQSIKIKNT